jgi:hypothetical protein
VRVMQRMLRDATQNRENGPRLQASSFRPVPKSRTNEKPGWAGQTGL